MKWDKANKDKLLLILRAKAEEIYSEATREGGLSGWHAALTTKRRKFLASYGLRMIHKDKNDHGWREVSYVLGGREPHVKKKNGIIIRYPFCDDADCLKYGWGLQVPRDVALKFLVLGIP